MDEALQSWLSERFPGASLVRAWPLTGGVSAVMTAFEAADGDGRPLRFILRQPGASDGSGSGSGANTEHEVLRWLAEVRFAAPQVYDFAAAGGRFGLPSLILGHIDGDSDLNPRDAPAFADGMAESLASLHAQTGAETALPMLLKRTDRVRQALAKEPDLESDRPYWRALTGRWPPPQVNRDVLLHGDFWPGNVLWRDGRIVAVIDWEECRLGDPLSDLAISRLDMLWVLDWAAMERFTERYLALSGFDATALPYWDLCTALRPGNWLEKWAGPWPAKGRPDVTFEAMATKLKAFGEQALARIG